MAKYVTLKRIKPITRGIAKNSGPLAKSHLGPRKGAKGVPFQLILLTWEMQVPLGRFHQPGSQC